MDSDNPSAVTRARLLLPHPPPLRATPRARPDVPERPGHSTDPRSPTVIDTPGERIYATTRGQVTTGMPTVARPPQPDPSPGASVPKRRPT